MVTPTHILALKMTLYKFMIIQLDMNNTNRDMLNVGHQLDSLNTSKEPKSCDKYIKNNYVNLMLEFGKTNDL